jgi:hypothetical protein
VPVPFDILQRDITIFLSFYSPPDGIKSCSTFLISSEGILPWSTSSVPVLISAFLKGIAHVFSNNRIAPEQLSGRDSANTSISASESHSFTLWANALKASPSTPPRFFVSVIDIFPFLSLRTKTRSIIRIRPFFPAF